MTLPGTSGLMNFRMRTYDPRLGRFLQADPIGYAGGANLFAYVGGDPVNLIDPWGVEEPSGKCKPTPEAPCLPEIKVTGQKTYCTDRRPGTTCIVNPRGGPTGGLRDVGYFGGSQGGSGSQESPQEAAERECRAASSRRAALEHRIPGYIRNFDHYYNDLGNMRYFAGQWRGSTVLPGIIAFTFGTVGSSNVIEAPEAWRQRQAPRSTAVLIVGTFMGFSAFRSSLVADALQARADELYWCPIAGMESG